MGVPCSAMNEGSVTMDLTIWSPILLLLTLGILWAVSKPVCEWLAIRRHKRQGRFCSWDEALQRVTRGVGYMVINKSNVEGRVWWTPHLPESKSPTILCQGPACLTDFRGRIAKLRRLVPQDRLVEVQGIVRIDPWPS